MKENPFNLHTLNRPIYLLDIINQAIIKERTKEIRKKIAIRTIQRYMINYLYSVNGPIYKKTLENTLIGK
jgi:hypothetical protein